MLKYHFNISEDIKAVVQVQCIFLSHSYLFTFTGIYFQNTFFDLDIAILCFQWSNTWGDVWSS
jgi:hypothetical protein